MPSYLRSVVIALSVPCVFMALAGSVGGSGVDEIIEDMEKKAPERMGSLAKSAAEKVQRSGAKEGRQAIPTPDGPGTVSPSVSIEINEVINLSDQTGAELPESMDLSESITVTDQTEVGLPATVDLSESIMITDSVDFRRRD